MDEKGTQNVKILAEKRTKAIVPYMPIGVKIRQVLKITFAVFLAFS